MIQDINCIPLEQMYKRVSIAVCLTDDYAPGQPIGRINILIKDRNISSIRNPSGYYVFTDLPAGVYGLVVESDYYFTEEIDVDTGALAPVSPVVNITLQPNSAYPFPGGSTSVRSVVRDSGGNAVQGASVHALIMLPEAAVKARVGQDGSIGGDSSIQLQNIRGDINTGDILMIKDSNSSRTEFCRIAAPLPADSAQPFNLTSPLKFNHPAGTPLHLMVNESALDTRTGDKGELVIYFRLIKAAKFLVEVQIEHAGCQTVKREVEVCEGSLTSLGMIQLSPL